LLVGAPVVHDPENASRLSIRSATHHVVDQPPKGLPILKTDFIFFSFGDPDNQVHAPNEFFRLESLDKGARAYVRLLLSLAAGN